MDAKLSFSSTFVDCVVSSACIHVPNNFSCVWLRHCKGYLWERMQCAEISFIFWTYFYKLLSYIYSKASYVLWKFFLFVIMNSKARCESHNSHFFLTKNVDLLHLLDSMWSESSGFSNYKVNHILNRISRSYFFAFNFYSLIEKNNWFEKPSYMYNLKKFCSSIVLILGRYFTTIILFF